MVRRDAEGPPRGGPGGARLPGSEPVEGEVLRTLFESMQEGYAYCRMVLEEGRPRDFVYLHVNPAFARLTSLENVVGRRVTEVVPGIYEANPEIFEVYGRVAATGRPERFETFVPGLGIWFSVSAFCPEPGCFVAVFDNVTARKQHDREIERLNRLYATLSGISQTAVRARTREELFRDVCQVAVGRAGFRLVWIGRIEPATGEVLPVGRAGEHQAYLEGIRVFADERPEGLGPVGTCVRGNRPSVFGDFQLDAAAAPWWEAAIRHGMSAVAAVPVHHHGVVWGALAVYAGEVGAFQDREVALLVEAAGAVSSALDRLDVEEQRREADRALRESQERLDIALSASRMGVWEWDLSTNAIFWSRECHEILGAPTGDRRLDAFERTVHPEDLERVMAAARKAIEDRRPFSAEFRVVRGDGNLRWVTSLARTRYDTGGQPLRLVGIVQDVTERVALEAQLRQALKMEAVGRLAGGVAHDFNNILTVIAGNSDLLLGQVASESPLREPLLDIRAAGERASSLTRQLLAFSRKQVLEPRLLDLNELVLGVERMLRRLIGEDIELVADLAPDLAWAKVDPGQMEQVILNLAVNARDAMPDGGRLSIRTRNELPPDEELDLDETVSRKRPCIALSVTDTGSGLTPEVRKHLFEPFFTTKPTGKGTGLGLATVYGIVRQSGGRISVESSSGKGTTFRISLPAHPLPAEAASGAGRPIAPLGTETVLVAEDEDAVRRTVRLALDSAGYRVLEARNGLEALGLVRARVEKVDLVLTDIVMPEMSGSELVERLRAEHPGVRALFMSGHTDDALVRRVVSQAQGAFLQKPFSPLALARKVREVLDEVVLAPR